MRALLVYPTHLNCAEVADEACDLGLDAVVYPARSTDGAVINCWNTDADEAERIGFPVVKTVCTTCSHQKRCKAAGYLGQLIDVQKAEVSICTHKRAEFSGICELSEKRQFVSIHENAIALLRPKCECSTDDLLVIQAFFCRLLNDPRLLNWFAVEFKVDDEGNPYRDEELAIRKDRLHTFCIRVADIVDDLVTRCEAANDITEWPIPEVTARPQGIERMLFRISRQLSLRFQGQPWCFILAAATSKLESAAILVHHRIARKGQETQSPPVKSIVGFRLNAPAPGTVTWFNDATISADLLSTVLNTPVREQTPHGQIELQKKAVQVIRDLTRATSPASAMSVLRGVLTDRPQFQRVGIIGHRPHLAAYKRLEPEFARRIVRTTYFGSGEERSSNAWHTECDLIIVAGTPRVAPDVVSTYLIQIGRAGAAARDAVWGPIKWIGKTECGERIAVSGRGYHDEDWRQAHRDLVRSTLVQAIGRGRGILENGCEVLVLSNEECGIPISDAPAVPLTEPQLAVLSALSRASAEIPNKYIGKTAVSTATLAAEVGLSIRQTRGILSALDLRGLVVRVGERGGWLSICNDDVPEETTSSQHATIPGEES